MATARVGTRIRTRPVFLLMGAGLLAACQGTESPTPPVVDIVCDLDNNLLFASLAPNAIPAINNPPLVDPDDVSVDYLFDTDKVLGVVINGEARAYPHNVLWHHEIVNDEIAGTRISVTFCPLTGSGLGFSPELAGRSLDVGVSGLLFANNLVMYDRTNGEVYGPQLSIAGACEGFRGSSLELMPVQEMSWGRWKELHPNTRVVSGELGFARNYRSYPYGSYDNINNTDLLMQMTVDNSRPIKERVLAIRDGLGGRGYPYGELRDMGDVVAINDDVGGIPTVVFFESRLGNAALAFDARVNGQTLTFDAQPGGTWVDQETNSTWQFDGTATGGPLAGEVLRTREDAYTVFWFAWRHFQPGGQTFTAP
ncbi:MAG: DUF3179 domain-containing protein [Gemmatimonadota bacterium]